MDGRILKQMPSDLRVKMDALVHDLTQALEETSCSSSLRIKVGARRRARSTGNIALINQRTTHSDDSISEKISRSKELSSFVQSDSDEVSANSQKRLSPYTLQKKTTFHQNQNFESDSVNENFSPLRRGTRRKRKMKRMDTDNIDNHMVAPISVSVMTAKPSLMVNLVNRTCLPVAGPSGIKKAKKKKILKNFTASNSERFDVVIGKRKHSSRDKCIDYDVGTRLSKTSRLLREMRDDAMDLDRDLMSSSSLSGSETDDGIYTNDEGREGDDEHSDCIDEARRDEDTDLETCTELPTILDESLKQIVEDPEQAYKERMVWMKEGVGDRQIRGGRRRLRTERPGFTVLTSANEKLSRFLQDCEQLTLKLHPMDQEERDQLTYLVNLYSLNMSLEQAENGDSCPVISKTSKTPQTVRIEQVTMNINDFKKRRKSPLV